MASQIPPLLCGNPKKTAWVWAEILSKLYWSQSFETVLVICAVDRVSLICILELDLFWILLCVMHQQLVGTFQILLHSGPGTFGTCNPSILYTLTSQWHLLTAPLISVSIQVLPLCWGHSL